MYCNIIFVDRGSAFARRRREREIELDSDEKDRQHEREEIEALRLNMIKKQVEGTEPEDDEVSDIILNRYTIYTVIFEGHIFHGFHCKFGLHRI